MLKEGRCDMVLQPTILFEISKIQFLNNISFTSETFQNIKTSTQTLKTQITLCALISNFYLQKQNFSSTE